MSEYRFEWFSGTGKGGQHRNKHQNCCRCIHIETGIQANGTRNRSREANKRDALSICMARVAHSRLQQTPRYQAGHNRVRTYHEPRNQVLDHASGETATYKSVIDGGDEFGRLIEARKLAMGQKESPGEGETHTGASGSA